MGYGRLCDMAGCAIWLAVGYGRLCDMAGCAILPAVGYGWLCDMAGCGIWPAVRYCQPCRLAPLLFTSGFACPSAPLVLGAHVQVTTSVEPCLKKVAVFESGGWLGFEMPVPRIAPVFWRRVWWQGVGADIASPVGGAHLRVWRNVRLVIAAVSVGLLRQDACLVTVFDCRRVRVVLVMSAAGCPS